MIKSSQAMKQIKSKSSLKNFQVIAKSSRGLAKSSQVVICVLACYFPHPYQFIKQYNLILIAKINGTHM
mgnify:CR=1 FL=1